MTTQEITKATILFYDNKRTNSAEFNAMFETKVDENLNSTFYGQIDIDEIIEAIDESGFEEDEYGDYPKLKATQLYDILIQVVC